MAERSFDGSVVVVTGAAGGIGRALVERFARAKAQIVALDLDEGALNALAEELERGGTAVLALRCDVTKQDDCERVARRVLERFGRVDVLINNAGVVHRSSFRDTDLDVFRRVMEVNYFGSLTMTKALLGRLVLDKGLIIVVSSVAGVAPLFGRSGYSASKHALHGLFGSLRAELAETGVEVLMVCPSFTRTAFEQRAMGARGERVARGRSRVGSEASPQDVADAIYHAARDRRQLLVLSPVGKLAMWLSRFAPTLYDRMMVRKLKSELAGGEA